MNINSLPDEVIVTILLLDLRNLLEMASVSKRFHQITSSNFDDNYWATLATELFGFKPLKYTKGDVLKMIRARENILHARFSCFRIPRPPRPSSSLCDSLLFHNRQASILDKPLPPFRPFEASPGFTRWAANEWKQPTNISLLYKDPQTSKIFANLVDDRLVEVPQGSLSRETLFIGDVIVFYSVAAHFDTSTPPDSDTWRMQWWLRREEKDYEWFFRAYFPEGMFVTDEDLSQWKIIPWNEVASSSLFDFNWDQKGRHYICKTFVCFAPS
jgi:hypothetical protein